MLTCVLCPGLKEFTFGQTGKIQKATLPPPPGAEDEAATQCCASVLNMDVAWLEDKQFPLSRSCPDILKAKDIIMSTPQEPEPEATDRMTLLECYLRSAGLLLGCSHDVSVNCNWATNCSSVWAAQLQYQESMKRALPAYEDDGQVRDTDPSMGQMSVHA